MHLQQQFKHHDQSTDRLDILIHSSGMHVECIFICVT